MSAHTGRWIIQGVHPGGLNGKECVQGSHRPSQQVGTPGLNLKKQNKKNMKLFSFTK